jgi:hypothetical protein
MVALVTQKLAGSVNNGVWTSGSNEGFACDVESKFTWCSTQTQLGESLLAEKRMWATVPIGELSAERCLALNLDVANGITNLKRANCSGDKKHFVCQVWSNKNENILPKINLFCSSPLATRPRAQRRALRMYSTFIFSSKL